MSRFKYSDDNKRYHTLYYHNLHTYGGRVCKAAIDAGLSCPNLDGSKGYGGCVFCGGGSGYFTWDGLSVKEQYLQEEKRIRRKFPDAKISAYFQAHSNTYSDVKTLRNLYRSVIDLGAFSLSIATRADCLDEEKALMLSELSVPVTVELGLQTAHDITAEKINRCHSYDDFVSGFELLKSYGLRVCVHIINGLPGETDDMMLETARRLGLLLQKGDGVKIHLLHVITGTRLFDMYERGEYSPMEKDRYIDIVARQLEVLPEYAVIERVTGDGDKAKLAAPLWSADKISVLGGIDKRQAALDSFQGKYFMG